jgi:hypothetical protein
VAELIDHGPPYVDRARDLLRGAANKFDFNAVRALHGRTLRLGQFLAEQLPISRLDHIEAYFSTLYGAQLAQLLSETHEKYAAAYPYFKKTKLDLPKSLANLRRLFEVRHILVHEVTKQHPYQEDEIENFIEDVNFFLHVAHDLLEEAIHGPLPPSNVERKNEAYRRAEVLASTMGSLFEEAKVEAQGDEERIAYLVDVQRSWEKWCDAECELARDLVRGGTAEGMLFSNRRIELLKQRIAYWQSYLNGDFLPLSTMHPIRIDDVDLKR